MQNGIIYSVLKFVFDNLKYLSIVELFKFLFVKFFADRNDVLSRVKYLRLAVDIFIILKWTLVIVLLKYSINNSFLTFLVWYLIISNIYTYFYYHIWKEESLNPDNFSIDRTRRRFITLLLSIGFSNLSFAYLFRLPYVSDFKWSQDIPLNIKSLWFSYANSITADYEYVKPITETGINLTITQLIISFVFLTIILGKSLPQTTSTE
ncbi:conserved membrane hypothetical protein [Tenacibaculum aestuarii]